MSHHDEPTAAPVPRRVALKVAWDGRAYCGWQRQLGVRTVQQELERAIAHRVKASAVSVVGSGRTDTGVHAVGQIAHVDLPPSVSMSESALVRSFNSSLPPDIRILGARYVAGDFHARFAARRREYRYLLLLRPSLYLHGLAWHPHHRLDVEAMQSAARHFLGTHDFTAVSKENKDVPNKVCSVVQCHWQVSDHAAVLCVAADRFIYSMIRAMVGMMVEIGSGKLPPEHVRTALAGADRSLCPALAPPDGLYLWRVDYGEPLFSVEESSYLAPPIIMV